ncbi:high nitrogen upregulated cytochrome P450 monooxygenase 2 [Polyporus arcularius HHB13444]|uniref:High nitrogen upregulated cytochrome P450 monooxygenase 2 n=1 Tax=Polyporus arcularius HHB13444 TaxID=1314778 RepID=A0A5C3PGX9_9APHY|nr:high nitrogen upregulated cytochrome P450 monooxygenase 2 [Polyporus arcularius HHB13444]
MFRRHETYSIAIHALLLFGAPLLLTVGTASTLTFGVLLSACWTYLVTLILSILLYRLSHLHPLSKYPGPICCRASKLWHACVVLKGRQHEYLQALHERYGDVVRIGPNDLSIRDASLIPAILGASGVPKGPNFHGSMLTATNPPMVGIQDTRLHLARRRPWARGLALSALKEYHRLVGKRTNQLVHLLENRHGTVVVLGEMFDYFSYDLMCDMAFGGGAELMEEGDPKQVWCLLTEGLEAGASFHQMDWLGVYFGHIPAVVKPLQTFLTHGKTLALERMQRGSTRRDLFHYLNEEDLPERTSPPLQQLVDDGILAIVGGSDTTSSCLTSVFFALLTHPETYVKLQAEVDKYYPAGENPCATKQHRDMTYLHAVINEALRLFPPVMTLSTRKVPARAPGVHIRSLYIPPGTSISIPPYALQRDPRNFSFPSAFWPERWLIASGQIKLEDAPPPAAASSRTFEFVHNEVAFMAFSHGPMNCVGKGFALQEIRTVVCALLQRFSFRLGEGWDPREYEATVRDYIVSSRPALPVILERRTSS